MTDDLETYRLAAARRDRQFATLVTLVVGLAAEEYPDELRSALSKVFDVAGLGAAQAELERRLAAQYQAVSVLEDRVRELERRLERQPAAGAVEANGHPKKGMLGTRGKA